MLAIQGIYEDRFQLSRMAGEKVKVARSCCFFLLGFCAGLRGEELPMMSLDAVRKYYDKPQKAAMAHVMLGLRGRIKGEYRDKVCHLIPIAATTRSGLLPRLWVGHLVELYEEIGVTGG